MRLVQVTIPAGERESILSVLEDEGIDFFVSEGTSGTVNGRDYTALVYFPVPTDAVEPVLDRLREAGLTDDDHAIIIDAETDTSRSFSELEAKYAEENGNGNRISREEMLTEAREMSPDIGTFLVMTIISAVVATAGLLLDSPAVVVGSMVIAPLIGPAIGASVGTVLNDTDLFRRGVKLQFVGGIVVVASATAFAFTVRRMYLVPPGLDVMSLSQVRGRLSPDFISLVVALGAGTAGVLSLSTGVSVALVGVMIAAALVPPAAAIGVGLAWGMPMVAVSAFVLVMVNLLAINLAGIVVLWYKDYRPKSWFRLKEVRNVTLRRIGLLVTALAVLSVFLGGVTYASVQDAQFETTMNDDVESVVAAQSTGDDLRVLDVRIQYDGGMPFRDASRVVVTVGRQSERPYDGLAAAIRDRINSHATDNVAVQVRFVEVQSAG